VKFTESSSLTGALLTESVYGSTSQVGVAVEDRSFLLFYGLSRALRRFFFRVFPDKTTKRKS